ncbi:MAG TPA: hypothetical protein VKG25_19835 [Bryobacteraceae bacterium]|nr:hypothetical protein [Bryobacteraceae bacterium]
MPLILLAGVTYIGTKFLDALVGKVAEGLLVKLKGDPAQKAFQKALSAAVLHYSSTFANFNLARPLLSKDGPLAEPEVAAELTQVVRFEREPDYALIGERWKAAVSFGPSWRDFTAEARLLVSYFRNELRATDVYRPVFDSKCLSAIAEQSTIAADALTGLEAQLSGLQAMMDARLGQLVRAFSGSSFDVQSQIRDFSRLIDEKTRGFVGRQFVFDAIAKFVAENPRGYYFVRGDPGIGKSALAAQLVKQNGYVHHFNVRAEGINKAGMFLRNICAQLIAAYGLPHNSLPAEAATDGGFFNRLLDETAQKCYGEKAVLVVDALDEVEDGEKLSGVNPLFLLVTLPQGIFIVITSRKERLDGAKEPVSLRIDCEQDALFIEQQSADNTADIREYVTQAVPRPGIQAYIAAQGIANADFVQRLVEKSQGNFIYLRYVLPEIERNPQSNVAINELPTGLKNYYESHWQRMKGADEDAWFRYKLPVVMALTVVKEPVSIDMLSDFSHIEDRSRILAVISDWAQFLYLEKVSNGQGTVIENRYRVYHASFHDFIAAKEAVQEEKVSIQAAHKKIAERLLADAFGQGS